MLPIQLKLKGIYSYQEEQIIDFTKLTQDQLFGIFGEVGSGKSTILEAMTLALFDETERLGKSNRNYNLMNLKSKELAVDFEFKAGKEQERYRFEVKGKRNSKRFSDVKTLSHNRYKWSEALKDWEPIKETAADIINLSYENFKRTIIIPQGKFQDFLQLKDAKRAEMMEEIFQLERFDLQKKVRKLSAKNENDLTRLEGRMSGLEVVSPDLIKEKKKTAKVLEKEIVTQSKEFNKLQTSLQSLNSLRADFIDWEKRKLNYKSLSEQKDSYKEKEKWLSEYFECQGLFKEIVSEMNVIKISGDSLRTSKKNLLEEKKQISEKVQQQEAKFKALKEKYERIEDIEAKEKNLINVIQMKKLQTNAEETEKKFVQLKVQLEKEEKEITDLKTSLEEKRTELQWLEVGHFTKELLERMTVRKKKIEESIQESEENKKAILKSIKKLIGDGTEDALLEKLLKSDGENQKILKQDFLKLQQLIRAENGQSVLLEYLLKEERLAADELILFEQSSLFNKEIKGNPVLISQKLKEEIEKTVEKLASKGTEKTQKKLNELSQATQRAKGEYDGLQKSFGSINISGLLAKSIVEIKEYKTILEKDKRAFETQSKSLEALTQRAKEVAVSIKDRTEQIEANEKNYQEQLTGFEAKVQKSKFKTLDTVRNYLKYKMADKEKERQEVVAFQTKISNEEAIIKQLEVKLKNKKYDEQVHQNLETQCKTLEAELELKKKEKNVLEEDLIRLNKALEEKKKLEEEQKRLEIRKTNIKELESMFRAKGFVNYVSGIKLKDLCNAANARFRRMTKNHLALELTNNNNFEIRDYMNGGETRSIKTLSGGQTFQAALSLAIALADIVNQYKGEKADFFFLDEGFGSLDKASLQIVFETLQSLKKENKIIGVISHVEELQEEIGTFLKIVNTEDGSRVKGSWEI